WKMPSLVLTKTFPPPTHGCVIAGANAEKILIACFRPSSRSQTMLPDCASMHRKWLSHPPTKKCSPSVAALLWNMFEPFTRQSACRSETAGPYLLLSHDPIHTPLLATAAPASTAPRVGCFHFIPPVLASTE